MIKEFFSWKGRIRRSVFCARTILIISIITISIKLGVFLLEMSYNDTYVINSLIVMLFFIVPAVCTWLQHVQQIKRSHDIGYSGWFILIPFYNPFFLMFMDGQRGQNKYGENPKRV